MIMAPDFPARPGQSVVQMQLDPGRKVFGKTSGFLRAYQQAVRPAELCRPARVIPMPSEDRVGPNSGSPPGRDGAGPL